MDFYEFYRVMAVPIAAIKCSHTDVRIDSAVLKETEHLPWLPFGVRVLEGKPYIFRDYAQGRNLGRKRNPIDQRSRGLAYRRSADQSGQGSPARVGTIPKKSMKVGTLAAAPKRSRSTFIADLQETRALFNEARLGICARFNSLLCAARGTLPLSRRVQFSLVRCAVICAVEAVRECESSRAKCPSLGSAEVAVKAVTKANWVR
jgi:hypothetical protein